MKETNGTVESEAGVNVPWHRPVMLEETIDAWCAPHGQTSIYVDGTVGNGGHAAALLARVPTARLLGIDRDGTALERARAALEPYGERVALQQGSYAQLDAHLSAAGYPPQVDGILLDLGLGTHQLDAAERGFSFRFDGPLDMRFDQSDSTRPTAADICRDSDVEALATIFRTWGEEPQAKRVARTIMRWREEHAPLTTTGDLLACLQQALPRKHKKHKKGPQNDGIARCFQALRIAVNEELQQLDAFLDLALSCLAPGGRLAVISFHSLEDRQVKHQMRAWAKGCICPPDLPICGCGQTPSVKLLGRRAIQASDDEQQDNPRARSARLRVVEKR